MTTSPSARLAESDFLRARRAQVLASLAARLRNDRDDVVRSLSFDEVVEALAGQVREIAGFDFPDAEPIPHPG